MRFNLSVKIQRALCQVQKQPLHHDVAVSKNVRRATSKPNPHDAFNITVEER
jgi:hypothetical protein